MECLYQDKFCKISVSYDNYNEKYIGHIEIYNWSLSVYKHIILCVGYCFNILKDRGILKVYTLARTEKNKKFNYLFGFKFYGHGVDLKTQEQYSIMEYIIK